MKDSILSPHILVVDDEIDLANLFQGFLEASGYRVTVAHDGIMALAAEEHDPADALITDLAMPRMDGKELITRMRERHPAIPTIVISGYVGHEILEGGQTIVLTKPVSLALLNRRLGELLHDAQTVRNFSQ